MVAHHAAHRKSRNIYTVFINSVFLIHFVDDCLQEIDILVAANVPGLVFAIGEYHHEARGIGNGLPLRRILLVGRILVHAVHLNDKRAILLNTRRSIHEHAAVLAVYR